MLMRVAAIVPTLLLGGLILPTSLTAATVSAAPPASAAYDYALRCYVVNVMIKDDAATKVAFEAVMKVGRSQGYTNRKLNEDFEQAPYREVRLIRDKAFLQQSLKECRTIGLAH